MVLRSARLRPRAGVQALALPRAAVAKLSVDVDRARVRRPMSSFATAFAIRETWIDRARSMLEADYNVTIC